MKEDIEKTYNDKLTQLLSDHIELLDSSHEESSENNIAKIRDLLKISLDPELNYLEKIKQIKNKWKEFKLEIDGESNLAKLYADIVYNRNSFADYITSKLVNIKPVIDSMVFYNALENLITDTSIFSKVELVDKYKEKLVNIAFMDNYVPTLSVSEKIKVLEEKYKEIKDYINEQKAVRGLFTFTNSPLPDNIRNQILNKLKIEYLKIRQPLAAQEKQESAAQKAKEQAEKLAQVEADKQAQIEANKKAQEEAAKEAQIEADRKAQEEATKKAEEAAKQAQIEAARKAQEEANKKIQEEAAKQAQIEAAKKAQEEKAAAAELKIQTAKAPLPTALFSYIKDSSEENKTSINNLLGEIGGDKNKSLLDAINEIKDFYAGDIKNKIQNLYYKINFPETDNEEFFNSFCEKWNAKMNEKEKIILKDLSSKISKLDINIDDKNKLNAWIDSFSNETFDKRHSFTAEFNFLFVVNHLSISGLSGLDKDYYNGLKNKGCVKEAVNILGDERFGERNRRKDDRFNNIDQLKALLEEISEPTKKLDRIVEMFNLVKNNEHNLYTYTGIFKSSKDRLTSTQQSHIYLLKQAYIKIVRENISDESIRNKVDAELNIPNNIINFNKSNSPKFFQASKTNTHNVIKNLLDTEHNNNFVRNGLN